MRTKEFEVPSDFITEFAEALAQHELTNEIKGVNEEGDILIEKLRKTRTSERFYIKRTT